MAPSLTGRGGGWVGFIGSRSSAPVSRPTARRSPHKSPSPADGGAVGGARWDDRRKGCPFTGGAAAQPMCQRCWRSGCHEAARNGMSSGASAAGVTPREPQASDWRDGRAAANTSVRPGLGLGGRTRWRSGRHRAQRIHQSRPVRQADLFTRSGKRKSPRFSDAGGPHSRTQSCSGWPAPVEKRGPMPPRLHLQARASGSPAASACRPAAPRHC